MSQHTPGPWTMETIRTSVGICHRIGPFPPRRPDDETVRHACLYADYPSAFNPADEELKANALLIAAAPELLDIVLDYVRWIEIGRRDADLYERAKAAIAKARGEA